MENGVKISKMEIDKEEKWILIYKGEVRNIFDNRKKAIKHLKEILKQSLKDIMRQDKTDDYDYPINIPTLEIKPVRWRESYSGLW